MIRYGFIILIIGVIATASWAYHINYKTGAMLARLDALRADIAVERESLQVLRIEWNYLNAPERLMRLIRKHQDALGLVPLSPEHLGHVAAVPYPPKPEFHDQPEPLLAQNGSSPAPPDTESAAIPKANQDTDIPATAAIPPPDKTADKTTDKTADKPADEPSFETIDQMVLSIVSKAPMPAPRPKAGP